MAFILGKKFKMDQVWKNDKVVPITLVKAEPNSVIQIKNKEKDGYCAVQIGFDNSRKKISKSLKGHLKDFGKFRHLKEFRVDSIDNFKIGDVLNVSQFQEGDSIKVSGLSKGRGFQGVVKRHGFSGGPRTHGQKNRLRAPGSIGNTSPQRVLKGRRMAGHMGMERMTIKNLEVVGVDKENNILMIKGGLPGMKGVLLEIRG